MATFKDMVLELVTKTADDKDLSILVRDFLRDQVSVEEFIHRLERVPTWPEFPTEVWEKFWQKALKKGPNFMISVPLKFVTSSTAPKLPVIEETSLVSYDADWGRVPLDSPPSQSHSLSPAEVLEFLWTTFLDLTEHDNPDYWYQLDQVRPTLYVEGDYPDGEDPDSLEITQGSSLIFPVQFGALWAEAFEAWFPNFAHPSRNASYKLADDRALSDLQARYLRGEAPIEEVFQTLPRYSQSLSSLSKDFWNKFWAWSLGRYLETIPLDIVRNAPYPELPVTHSSSLFLVDPEGSRRQLDARIHGDHMQKRSLGDILEDLRLLSYYSGNEWGIMRGHPDVLFLSEEELVGDNREIIDHKFHFTDTSWVMAFLVWAGRAVRESRSPWKTAAPKNTREEFQLVDKELKKAPDNVDLRRRWHQLRERLGMGTRNEYVDGLIAELKKDFLKMERWHDAQAFSFDNTPIIVTDSHSGYVDLYDQLKFMQDNPQYFEGFPEDDEDDQMQYLSDNAEWWGDPNDLALEFDTIMSRVYKILAKSDKIGLEEEHGLEALVSDYKWVREHAFTRLISLWNWYHESSRSVDTHRTLRDDSDFIENMHDLIEGAKDEISRAKSSEYADEEDVDSEISMLEDAVSDFEYDLTKFLQSGSVQFYGEEYSRQELEERLEDLRAALRNAEELARHSESE